MTVTKFAETCSIVIPVYRSEDTIAELIQQLAKTLPTLFPRFEVICVVDGSPDKSWEIIYSLGKKYKWLKGVKLLRNYGQQNATLCGVRLAKYELTATMDDDLQHPVRELPKLVEKLKTGFDVVYGSPLKPPSGFLRNLVTNITKRTLIWVTQNRMPKDISAFMIFRTHLRECFKDFRSSDANLDVLLSWGTSRFSSVKVNIEERKVGKSNYNLAKLIRMTLVILTGFSTLPLRIASVIGFLMTLVGLVILVYVLIVYFTQGSVPGFSFLASLIAIFSGTQLFALGIFGEYMARIFNRSMDRPTYVIEKTINGNLLTK
jgi:undecaprenyl-phosphate 4-deoxy-4-formamido-L-arabinose transferase